LYDVFAAGPAAELGRSTSEDRMAFFDWLKKLFGTRHSVAGAQWPLFSTLVESLSAENRSRAISRMNTVGGEREILAFYKSDQPFQAALSFVESLDGRSAPIAFALRPAGGTIYIRCSLSDDELSAILATLKRGSHKVYIQ
jgi:hypothetical protein